jgi:colanic acid/amylovoran biosynthesis glycosyltransferase
MEKKGIPYALEALGGLRKRIQLEITIIGDANSETRSIEEKKKIHDAVERWGLTPFVRFTGYQRYEVLMEEAYRHHVFLSPSITAGDGDTEGGVPVTLIEMAATGMPVVSSRHCDIPEVIHHGTSGLLAGERNANELLAHLEWLIDNRNMWRPMVEECRKHIDKEYNALVQGNRLAVIYQELVRE